MHKIYTILKKEWAEVFKNKMAILSVAFIPLLMTAIPLLILFFTRGEEPVAAGEIPAQMSAFCPAELNSAECLQVYMVSQFMMMFMFIPLIIPATISAYSVVGEKSNRTLEPLLATPISTTELLVGKALAALLPAVIATYLSFTVFAIGAAILVPDRTLLGAILEARWLIAVGIIGPLLALASVTFTVMISSRVTDVRVAEQLTSLLILPVLGVFFGQMAGAFVLNRSLIVAGAVFMLLIDVVLTFLATQIFQRETILTRWK